MTSPHCHLARLAAARIALLLTFVAVCFVGCARSDSTAGGTWIAPSTYASELGKVVTCGNEDLTIQLNRVLYAARASCEQTRDYLRQALMPFGDKRESKLATYTVSSTSELYSALKAAAGGDNIVLTPGNYGNVDIKNFHFNIDVTISSSDPAAMAIITKLDVTASSGIKFEKLEFDTAASAKFGGLFSVVDSSRITFDSVHVHGSLNGNPQDDVDGIRVLRSEDVKIVNSEFEQLRIAIGHRDSDGLVVSGNYIHDIRMDGIRGSGSDDVLISKNYITDFYRVEGDHADAIQFFTGSTTESARNITVIDNIIDRGDGLQMQGIFFRDENGGLPYINVKISGNVLVGTNYQGISVNGGKGIEISGNTVVSPPDTDSWISVKNVDGAIVSGNLVRDNNSKQYLFGSVTDLVETGNKVAGAVSDQGAATLDAWLKSRPDILQHFQEVLGRDGGATSGPELPDDVKPPAVEGPISEAPVGGGGADAGANPIADGPVWLQASCTDHGDLIGGDGVDTISFSSAQSSVRANLAVESRQNMLGGGKATIANVENVEGSSWNDTLTGTDGNNMMSGGDGNDKLVGGVGADTLLGGAGADSFHISHQSHSTVDLGGRDVILDFKHSEGDRIILRDMDAKNGGVDDPFTFVAKFTGVAGQVMSMVEGDHYVVMGDTNGDGQADFAVTVYSEAPLVRGDFLL